MKDTQFSQWLKSAKKRLSTQKQKEPNEPSQARGTALLKCRSIGVIQRSILKLGKHLKVIL